MCVICRAEWEPNVVWAHGRSRRHAGFHTSLTEIWQLTVALAVLTVAFAFFLGDEGVRATPGSLSHLGLVERLLIAFVAVGSGFILHELMHKFVAQWYGHWAEFRAQLWGLAAPIPLVLALGVIFAAPGAVVISGFVRQNENGIISAAGPFTNLVIALIALPFTLRIGTAETFGHDLASAALQVNAVLGIFNLIPFGPLDGRKVLRWNKAVYFVLLAGALALLLFSFGAL